MAESSPLEPIDVPFKAEGLSTQGQDNIHQINAWYRIEQEETVMPQQNENHLADGVDADKLLVEIVQGLLMAHARLDRMEGALRQAVETASLQHLTSFDDKLGTIDVRFREATADASKAVVALREARNDLVSSVQGASGQHLDAFTHQLHDVDGRFKETADQIAGTIENLGQARDDLVKSVERANQDHSRIFSEEVEALHKNVDHLRTDGVMKLHKAIVDSSQAEQRHYTELLAQEKRLDNALVALDLRISGVFDRQSLFGNKHETYENKQAKNWKNLDLFLHDWQVCSERVQTELHQHVSHERAATTDKVAVATKLIEVLNVSVHSEVKRNRIRLNWVIALVCLSLCFLGAIAYRVWTH